MILTDEAYEIAKLRCINKPVKHISKKLGIGKDRIEKVIDENILATNQFLRELVNGRKVENFGEFTPIDIKINDFSCDAVREILKDDRVLNYISLEMKDHHDRMMDCIRYAVAKYLKDCKD